jgi:hypothetical protein
LSLSLSRYDQAALARRPVTGGVLVLKRIAIALTFERGQLSGEDLRSGKRASALNSFRAEDEFDQISGLGRRPLGLSP